MKIIDPILIPFPGSRELPIQQNVSDIKFKWKDETGINYTGTLEFLITAASEKLIPKQNEKV